MANMQNDSTGRYTFLRALDVEQLEELLKTDYSASMSEDASEEFIDAIIEVMIEKEKENPSGRFTDVDKAWADFQNYYNVPEREGQRLYPDFAASYPAPSQKTQARRSSRVLRRVSLVVAAILVFFVTMVGAQAAGIDVFGFLAQWTTDVFHYKTESEYYPAIRDAFTENHFPKELVPKWYPDGFVAGEPRVKEAGFSTTVTAPFSNAEKDKSFFVQVRRYSSQQELAALELQWERDSRQKYTSGDKTFFIVSNEGYTTAAWSDQDTLVMTIAGDLSVSETEKIIDSMGG